MHSKHYIITNLLGRYVRSPSDWELIQDSDRTIAHNLGVIVENYATHKHPRVKRWLAARPRCHVHFTPTHPSWLNQVEIWFNRFTQQTVRRRRPRSAEELIEKVERYDETSNNPAQPFVWTKTARSIFAKVQPLCGHIFQTAH